MWEKAACAPCRIQQQRLAVLSRGRHLRTAQHQIDVDAANDDDAPRTAAQHDCASALLVWADDTVTPASSAGWPCCAARIR